MCICSQHHRTKSIRPWAIGRWNVICGPSDGDTCVVREAPNSKYFLTIDSKNRPVQAHRYESGGRRRWFMPSITAVACARIFARVPWCWQPSIESVLRITKKKMQTSSLAAHTTFRLTASSRIFRLFRFTVINLFALVVFFLCVWQYA